MAAPEGMTWALRLDGADAESAAGLRLVPGIETRRDATALWLRGADTTPELEHALDLLPGAERFAIAASGALIRRGELLARAPLPPDGWRPLADAVTVTLPPPCLPGRWPERLPLRLVPGAEEQPCTGLITAWPVWAAWVDTAPRHRLDRLGFSRSDDEALVLGEPLPPLPGTRLWRLGRCLLPAGLTCDPIDKPAMLARILALDGDDLAVFSADGSWDPLPTSAVQPATRANVRANGASMRTSTGALRNV